MFPSHRIHGTGIIISIPTFYVLKKNNHTFPQIYHHYMDPCWALNGCPQDACALRPSKYMPLSKASASWLPRWLLQNQHHSSTCVFICMFLLFFFGWEFSCNLLKYQQISNENLPTIFQIAHGKSTQLICGCTFAISSYNYVHDFSSLGIPLH